MRRAQHILSKFFNQQMTRVIICTYCRSKTNYPRQRGRQKGNFTGGSILSVVGDNVLWNFVELVVTAPQILEFIRKCTTFPRSMNVGEILCTLFSRGTNFDVKEGLYN
jgi:hypothetical protein